MHLIEACPLPTPADAERLLANLWQLTSGRALGLSTLGLRGERVLLGVHCAHPDIEETAAATIAEQCGAAVESGWMIPQVLDTAADVAAVNLLPIDRHLALDSRTFGWQRTDPLRGLFSALGNLAGDMMAGVALSLRALPDLSFVLSMAVFAAGPAAGLTAIKVASTYGGIGVRLRRPVLQRRAVRRLLSATIRRPAAVERVEVVSRFWHPPYGVDADLSGRGWPEPPALAGYLPSA